jgi:outer membrane protein assembly factor BamD
MRALRLNLLLSVLALVLGACASSGPAVARMEADELFLYGMERLEERDWSAAATAFERFTFAYATHPRAAEARYRLGESYMGRREYVTAAAEFNRLAAEHPAGPWADDARFQVCMAYYELSLPPQLDQEYTLSAIGHCESLITFYGDSEYVPRAREIIEEMTDRLAEKEYATAEQYLRRRVYDSANIYYHYVVDNYPGTRWAPRALLRLVESYGRLGYAQEEQAARERLLRDYPDSPEARQVNGVTAARRP